MRVADAVSKLRLLAADITLLCHDCYDPFRGLDLNLLFYRIMAQATIRTVAGGQRKLTVLARNQEGIDV
jgi:hypothetical protein